MLKIGLRPDCSLVAIFTFEMINPMPTLVYWEEHPDRRMLGPESSRPLGANSVEGMMGKVHERLDDRLIEFIGKQHLFFVGTAPDSPVGHLNVSPKGLDTFRILGPTSVAYLDLTGSGIETVAHLRENGRITILYCAFEGRPLILRLYGRGRVVEPGDPEWGGLIAKFTEYPGVRSVVVVDVGRIADSCGFAVPLYEYQGDRSQLIDYAEKKGPEGMEAYKARKNRASIDGIARLRAAGGEGR
jgi:Pyridoxamine 5'-phosphate oxidase